MKKATDCNAYTARIRWDRSERRGGPPLDRAGIYTGTLCGVRFVVRIASNPGGSFSRSSWNVYLTTSNGKRQLSGITGGLKEAGRRARSAIRDEIAYRRGDLTPAGRNRY